MEINITQNLKKLTELVNKMASPETEIEQSFLLYKEALDLVASTNKAITEVEGKLKQLEEEAK